MGSNRDKSNIAIVILFSILGAPILFWPNAWYTDQDNIILEKSLFIPMFNTYNFYIHRLNIEF